MAFVLEALVGEGSAHLLGLPEMATVVGCHNEKTCTDSPAEKWNEWILEAYAVQVQVFAFLDYIPNFVVRINECFEDLDAVEMRSGFALLRSGEFSTGRSIHGLNEESRRPAWTNFTLPRCCGGIFSSNCLAEGSSVNGIHSGQVVETLGDAPGVAVRLPVELGIGEALDKRFRFLVGAG